ncbi:hypothetical protein KR009_002057, partial [Drosophila setifemur]
AQELAEMSEREPESDEDCEVYCEYPTEAPAGNMSLLMDYSAVLKPVNEYNIVDRIKEANKELFAPDDGSNGNGKVTKVKFALNLEDYEPGEEPKDQSPSPPDELLQQLAQLKLRTIAEEEPAAPVVEEAASPSPPPETDAETEAEAEPEPEVEEVEEEEICEEILDLTEIPVVPEAIPAIPLEDVNEDDDDDDFSGVDEADLDDSPARQDPSLIEGDSDQRSLTNLLTESDCEEEERTLLEARQKLRDAYKNLYKTLDPKQQATIDRLTGETKDEEVFIPKPMALPPPPLALPPAANEMEEEDDLSIIVASYIPDDFELNEQSIYYKKDEPEEGYSKHVCPKATSKTFFTSRSFSFRRRAKPTPSSASGSTTSPPSIRMNYKICCEQRNSLQGKLPRYTGYLSEYGLSAQQLQKRDQQMRRKQRFSLEQSVSRNEQEMKKMQDNERAFTTWLKNKMRYPINKTRNMFDAHKRRGSVAACGSPRQNHHNEEEQLHHRGLRRRRRDSDEEPVHPYRHLLGSWNK